MGSDYLRNSPMDFVGVLTHPENLADLVKCLLGFDEIEFKGGGD